MLIYFSADKKSANEKLDRALNEISMNDISETLEDETSESKRKRKKSYGTKFEENDIESVENDGMYF